MEFIGGVERGQKQAEFASATCAHVTRGSENGWEHNRGAVEQKWQTRDEKENAVRIGRALLTDNFAEETGWSGMLGFAPMAVQLLTVRSQPPKPDYKGPSFGHSNNKLGHAPTYSPIRNCHRFGLVYSIVDQYICNVEARLHAQHRAPAPGHRSNRQFSSFRFSSPLSRWPAFTAMCSSHVFSHTSKNTRFASSPL